MRACMCVCVCMCVVYGVCVHACMYRVCDTCVYFSVYVIVPTPIYKGATQSVDATVLNIVEGRVHLDQSEDRPRPHARSTRAQRKQAAAGTVQVRGVSSLVAAVASEWYWRAVRAWGSSCQTMHSLVLLLACCVFQPLLALVYVSVCPAFLWSCVDCLVLCCLFGPVLFV